MRDDPLGEAVLHEGSLLYPYRTSAAKNAYPWTFGVVVPPRYRACDPCERDAVRVECLLIAEAKTPLELTLRFLQQPESGPVHTRTPILTAESVEALCAKPVQLAIDFDPLEGLLRLSACAEEGGCYRVVAEFHNSTPFEGERREQAIPRSFLSVQLWLHARQGRFVSAIDPPEAFRERIQACRNEGLWPVLAGPKGSEDRVLAAPIILPDHPELAPESQVAMFDATEIDEMLALRVRTLTPSEKQEARRDPRGAALLDAVEALDDRALAALHGAWRTGPGSGLPRPGQRVRVRRETGQASSGARRGDILDVVLAGRIAVVQEVAEDREGRSHVAVVFEEDPGRDLGWAGWPGHRFFFDPSELELL